MSDSFHELKLRPQGPGVPQSSAPLVVVRKRQGAGAVQDTRAALPGCLWLMGRLRGRKFVETLVEISAVLAGGFTPRAALCRYRVAPRANPAAMRYNLLLGIQLELHRAGLVTSRQIRGRTTV